MPIPHPPSPDTFWDNLTLLGKIVGPFIAVIVSLLVYLHKRQDKNISDGNEALVKHVESDDAIHDKLFTELRAHGERLAHLEGELGHKIKPAEKGD